MNEIEAITVAYTWEQGLRVHAMKEAREILTAKGFGGSSVVPSVEDIIHLADWIVDGPL